MNARQHGERLLMEAAGVEGKDRDRQSGAQDQVSQHHVFGRQARREYCG